MAITKENVKQWIQEYADNSGNVTVISTLGSGGTSWQGDSEQGMLAVCDGMADSINDQISIEVQIRHANDIYMFNIMNGSLRVYCNMLRNILINDVFPRLTPPQTFGISALGPWTPPNIGG